MSAPKDDLYVEIEYTPGGSYKWYASLRSESDRYRLDSRRSDFEWLIHLYARQMIAARRKRRKREQRAKDYGKKVIR